MSLNELYQQKIKQHNLSPMGEGKIDNADLKLSGYNPSCGDELEIFININSKPSGSEIVHIGFEADACAICKASLSILCEHSIHKPTNQLLKDITHFQASLNKAETLTIESLFCLTAVTQHPSRINCALLPWQTLQQILTEQLPTFLRSIEAVNA